MPPVIRAIVGRFSFAYSRQAMEEVLRQYPFEFCAQISSGVEPQYFRSIPAEKQDWFISSEIRSCHYRAVDWNVLAPLDEALIEGMRECEVVFMEMVARLEWKRSIPFDTRKRWYLQHLRFWNDYLTRHRINLYLSAWMPHEIPDIIIYYLCKRRDIPLLYFECAAMVRDTSFAESDWRESAVQIRPRYEALCAEYAGVTDPLKIPLGERFEERYRALTQPQGEQPPTSVLHWSTYWEKAVQVLWHQPLRALTYVIGFLTPRGVTRILGALQRLQTRRSRNAFYQAHAIDPDLTCSFVYLPLHYQPEASTMPMSGCFVDQRLMVQLLSAHLPPGVLLYVKEHFWESGWLMRDTDYYKELVRMPNVRLIRRNADTFALREHCRAVATGTGTAGFEALFRGKPVFLFGHRFYQYARGVHRIHSSQDCAEAVRKVFQEGEAPTLFDCRLYLKAMEETCVHGVLNPWHYKVTRLSDEENLHANREALIQGIKTLFGQAAS